MIDYRTCMVPDIKLRKKIYVWVAYSKDPPYLPIGIGLSAEELARKCGVSCSTVKASWSKYVSGKIKKSRFHRVKVGYDLALEGNDV